MAKTKTKINKTKFIMGFGGDIPALKVVAAGKKKGVVFSDKYVYNIRAKMKNGAKRSKVDGAKTRRKVTVKTADGAESAFVDLVLELGTTRSDELIAKVRASAKV